MGHYNYDEGLRRSLRAVLFRPGCWPDRALHNNLKIDFLYGVDHNQSNKYARFNMPG